MNYRYNYKTKSWERDVPLSLDTYFYLTNHMPYQDREYRNISLNDMTGSEWSRSFPTAKDKDFKR